MKHLHSLCCLLFLSIILSFTPASAAQEPIRVVTTIFPLADIVRQVGGPRVAVSSLLPAGASPHTFEPKVSQMRQVADAALFVRVGAGLDSWGDRLLTAARKKPVILTVTDGVRLVKTAELELIEGQGHDSHDHAGDNPHVWLDPVIVRDNILPAVVDALVRLSPGDSRFFKTNARRYFLELSRLNLELTGIAASLKKKDFIAMHGAWPYLAQRYGLRQMAAVEPFPGKEPSAKYIAALVSTARRLGVTTIFAEPQISSKASRVIADEIKGKVLVLDPLGGETIPGRNSYVALMRYNFSMLLGGMKQ